MPNMSFGLGSLFHNTAGYMNTANGVKALYSNTTGYRNTANGYYALMANTSGYENMAMGYRSLFANTSGNNNVATGVSALASNTTGYRNTADGVAALPSNTTGQFNTAIGWYSGYSVRRGNYNIDIGNGGAASESRVIRFGTPGTHTSTFIAGISGVASPSGVAVYISSNGKLGTLPSSRRFKYDIRTMDRSDKGLMRLRPVSFRYKAPAENGAHPVQYGLIAEEVARIYPQLVQFDKAGKPFTIYYQQLTPMLLNEIQQAKRHVEAQRAENSALRLQLASLKQTQQNRTSELASLKATQQQQLVVLARLNTLVQTSANRTPIQRTDFAQNQE
jgi:hypothetical protein